MPWPQSSNETSEGSRSNAGHNILTQLDWPATLQQTARSSALFRKVFSIYECRQSMYTNLCPPDVARLLQAANEEDLVGRQERAKYLNPMRDLFTDNELLQLQNNLARMEDHRIVIWGPDLSEFLRRVQDANNTPTAKVLDLWIMEVSTKSAERLEKEGFEGLPSVDHQIYDESTRDNHKQGPSMELPGEWTLAHNCDQYGNRTGYRVVVGRRQSRVEGVRLHRKYAYTARHGDSGTFAWNVDNWQIDPPVRTVGSQLRHDVHWHFAMISGRSYPETYFQYITTKDMKIFHLKTAREGWGSMVESTSQREFILLNYNATLQTPEHPHNRPEVGHGNPFRLFYNAMLRLTRCQNERTALTYQNMFYLSLKDSSQDDAHDVGTVLTFGVNPAPT